MQDKERPEYLSYLLRLWRASGEDKAVWRASLEDPHSGDRWGFASLADLFTYLEEETGRVAEDQARVNREAKGGDAHTISDYSNQGQNAG
jgi:hypothetical protein